MKKIWIIPIVFLFASCSKETTSYNPCNNIVAVLFNSNYNHDTTAIITYDAERRVKTVRGQMLELSTYNYYNDHIDLIATDIYGNNIGTTYILDRMHRIVSAGGGDSDFVYNADGYLSSYRSYYVSGQIIGYDTYYLNYDSGNLVKVYTNAPNVSRQQVTFTYYNKPNQDLMGYNSPLYLSEVIEDRNTFYLIKGGYFGKQSKNLLYTIDFHNPYSGGVLTYIYDNAGRIISTPDAYSYIYQCQ